MIDQILRDMTLEQRATWVADCIVGRRLTGRATRGILRSDALWRDVRSAAMAALEVTAESATASTCATLDSMDELVIHIPHRGEVT